MIKLQVIGNLGRDCQVKEVNGKNVINFNVAHTERYKDAQGNQKERTTWVECAYWTDRTAISPYLTKGQMVYVEGAPEADAYMNKENQAAATLRLRVSNIQLLGNKGSNSNNDGQVQQQPQQQAYNSGNGYASQSAATSMAVPASIGAAADDLPF
jgi:single-strand DNA-binding protein